MPLSSLQRRWLVRAACFALFAGVAFGVGRQLQRPEPPPRDTEAIGRHLAAWLPPSPTPPRPRVAEPETRERRLPEDDEHGWWPLVPPVGPYELAIEHAGTVGGEWTAPHGELRLLRRATGETVWSRTVRELWKVRWSADGRAVAVLDASWGRDEHPSRYRLHTWSDGGPVRVFDDLAPFHEEHVAELAWSPDRRRLLLLTAASQGSGDMGFYDWWLLTPAAAETRRLPHRGVAVQRAEWLSATRVRYVYVLEDPPAAARRWEERSATAELTVR